MAQTFGAIHSVELPARDVATSAAFYQEVFGWNVRSRGDGATAFDDGPKTRRDPTSARSDPMPEPNRTADLEAIETRIWTLLEPYREELESATIYGMPSLRWPGAKAHDYFASVRAGKRYVSLYLLVADTYPEALEGTSETLLKRRSGKATFNFPNLDADLADDLAALLARFYERYRADHAAA